MVRKVSIFVLAVLISASGLCQEADTSTVAFPISSADATAFIRPEYRAFTDMLSLNRVQVPLLGNDVEITRGIPCFEMIMADLAAARESVHMEYYEFPRDEIPGAVRGSLMEKAMEGVDVKVLVENVTNMKVPMSDYREMRSSGIELRFFDPFMRPLRFIFRLNHRNHQKIAVIDRNIGYIGGMNMADKYFKTWGDTHLRVEGPAASVGIDGVFWNMWQKAGTEAYVPFADTVQYPVATSVGKIVQVVTEAPFDGHRTMEDSYVWLLDNTTDYFYARTPYFSPPGDVLDAMKRAAMRGADVRLIVPAVSDVPIMDHVNRSFFRTCLRSGIRIYTSRGPFNHSKTFVTDDYVTGIGSVNMDYRSFRINYEDNAFIYDPPVAGGMKGEFVNDCETICDEITLSDVSNWTFLQKIKQGLSRLLSPLM